MAPSLEERVVAALCRDGRADLRTVADRTDATVRTVRDRIETLEADGTIAGYTARLDYEAVACVTAVVRLRVARDAVGNLSARLRDRPGFVTVYETTGRFAIVAVGRFADVASFAEAVCELHVDPDVDGVDAARVERVGCERDSPLLGD